MEALARPAAGFLPAEERTPESFWTSLRYFNLYRVSLATLFLSITLTYGDDFNLGTHSLRLFRIVCIFYLAIGIGLQAAMHRTTRFNLHVSLQMTLAIVAITLLMYASGGIRSGLGVMLLISLTGAAIVAPRRLTYLYAALATIALLLEQGYWVLAHDAPSANFVQPALLAIGCFATAGVTGWLAQRVAANEALARSRGRALATQTRVNQLVIEDMQDGIVVLDRYGRVVQHNPQAQRLLGAARLTGEELAVLLPGFANPWRAWHAGASAGSADLAVRGRDVRLRLLDASAEEKFSVV